MTLITQVNARTVAVPLRVPIRMATRHIDARYYTIVEVVDEDGVAGVGYSYDGVRAGGLLLKAAIEGLLAPTLLGKDGADIRRWWREAYQETLLQGRRGAVLRAMAAVDIALWDLKAKRAGLPLAELLGGAVTPVPAYASGGYYLAADAKEDPAEAVASEVSSNRSRGFADHKIKVGGLSIADDARRVAAAIEAVGPGRLALDANNAYRTVGEALQALSTFERAAGDAHLWWFEEPLEPDDIRGHAQLAARTSVPIATGEIHQTRHEFAALLESRAAAIVQVDVCVVGGVTEWLRVAALAEVHGALVAPHWHANLHAHLAPAASNVVTVEHFLLDKDISNFERLLVPDSVLDFSDGMVFPASTPGHGIEFDSEALNQFTVR